jgi:hypothetical protein
MSAHIAESNLILAGRMGRSSSSVKPLRLRTLILKGEGRNRAVHVRFYEENIRNFANKCKHFCATLNLSERTHYLPPY